MYGKREVCTDTYTCACLSVNQATIGLWICVCVSVLAWDVKAKWAGEDVSLCQKDPLKLNMPCRACKGLCICEGEGT